MKRDGEAIGMLKKALVRSSFMAAKPVRKKFDLRRTWYTFGKNIEGGRR
jgi:hypothetical protein